MSPDVADQAKKKCDELLNLMKYEKNNEFCNVNSKKDWLDAFFAKYLTSDSYKDLWHIWTLIFVMSQDQSNVERGFSVKKEVVQDNLQMKSLSPQRVICTDSELYSWKFAFSKYKGDLERRREEKIAVAVFKM